jgi:hypothetical protein
MDMQHEIDVNAKKSGITSSSQRADFHCISEQASRNVGTTADWSDRIEPTPISHEGVIYSVASINKLHCDEIL